MRTHSLVRHFASVSLAALVAVACGGSSSSEFGKGDGNQDLTNGELGGNNSLGGDDNGTGGSSGGLNDGDGCVAQPVSADRVPAHLFFILDQSLSMDNDRDETKTRWAHVTSAFKQFLKDPLSEGVSASLQMFPLSGRNVDECSASTYGKDLTFHPLPDEDLFSGNLNRPSFYAATPTAAVLQGVAPKAKQHADENPDVKTAIVFMTDGLPQSCPNSNGDSLEPAKTAVSAVKDTVPTYVIGVGQDINNLNELARAGGTAGAAGDSDAFLIDDRTDAAAAEQKFREAVDAIRGKTLSCEVVIPPAPEGESLDLNKVNVTFTPSNGGAKQNLAYDETCAANGWKFDSATDPKKIVLCTAACNAFKADPKGVVNVEFGCATRIIGVK